MGTAQNAIERRNAFQHAIFLHGPTLGPKKKCPALAPGMTWSFESASVQRNATRPQAVGWRSR
jgi:hypothetical protein